MDETQTALTSTQRGQIAEAIVAAQLMLASNGRLSPFRPAADDDGTDLLVMDKATGRIFSIQVKARFAGQETPPKYVQFDTRLATFRELRGGYLLAVLIDPASGALWRGWAIPAAELKAASNATAEKLAISPNPSAKSQDRYSQWRCNDAREVVLRLLA